MTKQRPVREITAAAVIIRACWERGPAQMEAKVELIRRGLWLNPEQETFSRSFLVVKGDKK